MFAPARSRYNISVGAMSPHDLSNAMLSPGQFTVFDHLNEAGVPLRASSRFGDDMAAALWERNEHAATNYAAPTHHTVSLYVDGGESISRRREDGTFQPSYGAGSVCLMPAGVTTEWQVDGAVRLFHFYVPRSAFDRLLVESFDRDPALTQLVDVPFVRDATIENVIRHAILPLDWHDAADRVAVTQAGQLLLAYIASRFTERPATVALRGGLAPSSFRRVADFVEASLDQPLAIGDLAAAAGLSAFHFTRMFRRSAGVSPHAFVNGRRIARAKSLLEDGSLPLAEIALACGFSSQSHFTARFREAVGVTPGQYARHMRGAALS